MTPSLRVSARAAGGARRRRGKGRAPTTLVLAVLAWAALSAVLGGAGVHAQEHGQEPTTYIQFIFDASISMRDTLEDGQSRMDVAKAVLEELITELPDDPHVEVALRVYGGGFATGEACEDTAQVVDFGPVDAVRGPVLDTVMELEPRGMTPIGLSLEQAAGDFPVREDARNIIVLITDGMESCMADPCAISRRLQEEGVILEPYVVGFALPAVWARMVECIGDYYDADDTASLRTALEHILTRALAPTTLEIQGRAAGENVTADMTVTLWEAEEHEISELRAREGRSRLSVQVQPGVYTVEGHLAVGPDTLTAQQRVHAEEARSTPVVLDFGSLDGSLRVVAEAGGRDVSDGVDLRVERDGALIDAQWQGMPPQITLPAGTYQVTAVLRDDPGLSRRVTALVRPQEVTDLRVDLGELPARLEVRAVYRGEDVTSRTELEVYRDSAREAAFPSGQQRFFLETDPGSVDLLVRYTDALSAVKRVSGIRMEGGETRTVVVDLGQVLGTLRARVMAGDDNVTADSRVEARGMPGELALPEGNGYRAALVPSGTYRLQATHQEGMHSDPVQVEVPAGAAAEAVLELALPGVLELVPLFGEVPAPVTEIEGHVWDGDAYVGQMLPREDYLELALAPGAYRLEGLFMTTPVQRTERAGIEVASHRTTRVTMSFRAPGVLRVVMLSDSSPYDDMRRVDVHQEGELVTRLRPVRRGSHIWEAELLQGTYDLRAVPRTAGLDELWARDLQVPPLEELETTMEVGGVGTWRLEAFSMGEPFDDIRIVEFFPQGEDRRAAFERYSVEPGVFAGEIAAGVYDMRVQPAVDGLEEQWIRGVAVAAGETSEVEASFAGSGFWRVVTTSAGEPFDDIRIVEVFPVGGERRIDFTRRSVEPGVFQGEVATGEYEFKVEPAVDGMAAQRVPGGEIGPGDTLEVRVSFPGVARWRVLVTADGEPFDDIRIVELFPEGADRRTAFDRRSVAPGVFEGEIVEGVYDVRVTTGDRREVWVRGQTLDGGTTGEVHVEVPEA